MICNISIGFFFYDTKDFGGLNFGVTYGNFPKENKELIIK